VVASRYILPCNFYYDSGYPAGWFVMLGLYKEISGKIWEFNNECKDGIGVESVFRSMVIVAH